MCNTNLRQSTNFRCAGREQCEKTMNRKFMFHVKFQYCAISVIPLLCVVIFFSLFNSSHKKIITYNSIESLISFFFRLLIVIIFYYWVFFYIFSAYAGWLAAEEKKKHMGNVWINPIFQTNNSKEEKRGIK